MRKGRHVKEREAQKAIKAAMAESDKVAQRMARIHQRNSELLKALTDLQNACDQVYRVHRGGVGDPLTDSEITGLIANATMYSGRAVEHLRGAASLQVEITGK